MRRLLVVALVLGAMFSGCVVSGGGSSQPTRVDAARVEPDAASTTTTAGATVAFAEHRASDGAPVRSGGRTRVGNSGAAVRTVSPAPGSPWGRYDGQLTGGSYIVAHAVGAGLPVSPSPDTPPATTLSNPLPSGAPRVLLVVHASGEWLQVLLPVRPNSSVGWVRRSDVSLSTVPYRVEIDRGLHRIRLFDGGEAVVVDELVAIGKPSTPTPSGQFFTIELLQPTNPAGDYGPYAFTLSAYSEVYQTFGSGDGAVGIHGTNQPSSIGTAASHGCVRLRNDVVSRLAGMLPLGTPVFIR